ncbi:MAG: Phosphopentomutase [Erysipelotrichaceae bacterium]|nr:MAG: Phosphopentomutase [Erysipelotrichaceae bacterium]
MNRFIVIVLDGFGIGSMEDTHRNRPEDAKANTLRSILNVYPDLRLPTLEKLGIMNAAGFESKGMKFNSSANFGRSALMHNGADTFMGHQEIMGTLPKKSVVQCLNDQLVPVKTALLEAGYKVQDIKVENLTYFLVEDYVAVADNIDSDLGQAINCIAPLDNISFEKLLEIAQVVRKSVTFNRVIPFGGTGNTIEDILAAQEVKENRFIGNVAVKTKAYLQGYRVIHLGYGVDDSVQVPALLYSKNISSSLFGKVADIVSNPYGKSVSCVDTQTALQMTIEEIKLVSRGFICTNVQETDLAGHSMNSKWYKEILEIADRNLSEIIELLDDQDLLIVMADHGNDPEIGHNHHTREYVPLLAYQKGTSGINIGTRKTMSDVGASVCDWFESQRPQNGDSFAGYFIKKDV